MHPFLLPWSSEWRVLSPTDVADLFDRQPIRVAEVVQSRDVSKTRCVQISGGQRASDSQSEASNEQRLNQWRASTTGQK